MKITETQVTKLQISDIKHLDPVNVLLEDFGPGQGKITIECFGKAWTSYWNAMWKENTIDKFFCDCDNEYDNEYDNQFTISFDGDNFYIENNILFDKPFIMWYLNKYHNFNIDINTPGGFSYMVNLIDNNINCITLTDDECIILTKDNYCL